jgi:hypothetical protein
VAGVRSVWARLARGVRARVRLLLAAALLIGAAVALALGWYGVSGQALVAKQLPYLVSGGLLGVALVILAAVLVGADIVQRELGRLERVERLVEDLHTALLTAPDDAAPTAPTALPGSATAVVAVPAGATYHRPECALVAGKAHVAPVKAAERTRRGLRPCRGGRPAARAAARADTG